MLFYLKKHVLLELLVTLVLGGVGVLGIRSLGVPAPFELTASAGIAALVGALVVTAWTLLVQLGYRVVRGRAYAEELTLSLARHFDGAPLVQIAGGFVAAAGEELFFRGFIQGAWGLIAGSVAFMLAHIGKKDIRVIGYWSIFQGLGFGLVYRASGNLLAPVVAHGLFDAGAMLYFRVLTRNKETRCAS
jgi:membrane protease YdiL (CAAX protease family)